MKKSNSVKDNILDTIFLILLALSCAITWGCIVFVARIFGNNDNTFLGSVIVIIGSMSVFSNIKVLLDKIKD